jgi:regulator of sigma E protease
METVFEGLKVVFFGLLMFSLIVTVHEAGHFTAARLFGLRVKEFMLGLPGPNIGFTFKGTKFGVTPFLLGGYALIAGENSSKENPHLASAYGYLAEHGTLTEDEARAAEPVLGFDLENALDILDAWGTVKRTKRKGHYTYAMPATALAVEGKPRVVEDATAHINAERKLTFNAAPWYQRVIILAAGVIFNLIFAVVIFTAAMMILGTQVPSTTLASIVEDSPAAHAGLVPGDTIIALQGTPVDSWEDFTALMADYKPDDEVTIVIAHEGVESSHKVILADESGRALLGVSPTSEKLPISFGEALVTSIGFIGMVATAIAQLFNPATFTEVVSQSSSVIGVSFLAKDAAESGFLPFIVLSAALSISIGLMNILPLPPLDGGRIVVETIERITRRTIPARVVSGVTVGALTLLIMLFVFVTGQDIQRYILGG